MQIFLLHEDPEESAKALCDKHVPKLTLEAVQIANTGLNEAGYEQHAFYGSTHKGHPWCEFAAKSFDHFEFVLRHAHALGREFLRRYDDRHTSHVKTVQNWTHDDMRAIERDLGRAGWEQVYDDLPQAMPVEYKQDDPIEAYRDYYCNEKMTKEWFTYDEVEPPTWFAELTPMDRWF